MEKVLFSRAMSLFLNNRNVAILRKMVAGEDEDVFEQALAKTHRELDPGERALLDAAALTSLQQVTSLMRWNRHTAEDIAAARSGATTPAARPKGRVAFFHDGGDDATTLKRESVGRLQSDFEDLQEVYERSTNSTRLRTMVLDDQRGEDERWRLIEDKPIENMDALLAGRIKDREALLEERA